MSPEAQLYSDVKAALEAIPELKQVQLYNGQDIAISQGQQDVYMFPCAWINFVYSEHGSQPRNKVQDVTVDMQVYLCGFTLKDSDIFILNLKKKIYNELQGLKESNLYNSLNRSGQQQVAFGDGLPIFVQVFRTTFKDVPELPREVDLLGVDVEKAV